ncbi:MAG TPA: potassium-transporting ATPase subunit KdpA [Chloroflexota bacterium]|nr:potassium-transporting ATPase subunit KdpA [Chloroflexota bacterium]
MTTTGILEIVLFLGVLLALTKPLGAYMARVYQGERTFLAPLLGPVERLCYRVCGVNAAAEQGWKSYTAAMLLFNLAALLLLFLLQRTQAFLPFNPQGQPNVPPDLAWNTAVSFTTNTNWQNYAGETTLSYLVQMAGLTVHNFVSAATGMAIAVALIRGLARRSAQSIGNFWVDLVRSTLYILLPISIVGAVVLVALGIPQNLNGYTDATTLEGLSQTIAQGPVASQEIIKELGTNGGGFFNANSAHPFENPTPLTNFITNLALILIPAGLLYTFGRMVGSTRQGWVLWAVSAVILVLGLAVALPVEQAGNPLLTQLGVDQVPSALQAGGNFEGKEVRNGIAASVLWAVTTTATSCGAINAWHDSFLPVAGMIPLINLKLGEIVFGGVGAGLYGLLIYAILAVFIAGLMVGRTPEYLGKKIESFEIKMAMLVTFVLALSVLGFSALSASGDWGTAPLGNPGPHGLSEILYAFASTTGNNGSAFGGLSGNTLYYNTTLGLAMLIGRFLMIVPILAVAGSMARKRRVPPSLGTFPTTGPVWVGLLTGTVLIVGALTYFPALSLGPIIEQLLLNVGKTFS